ncbi:HD domain-containing phosphohydrolase [uncultured Rhodospira sp.]|uniref:HD-GYP domain-containing protein n=1 Tax=uncultured Rhodospira sp. TaxID=1936189 RepID=UPI002627ADDB|nr:HD domain-containing phosphohydrolase [uncultured Rhodospira sp.]
MHLTTACPTAGPTPTLSPLRLDLRELIYVLSGVLDFVGVSDVSHGKRVAYMAVATGRALGLDPRRLDALFEAALLHDAGVSTTREHDKLISQYAFLEVDWHCVRGQDLFLRFPPTAHLAPIIAYHHTPWSRLREADNGLSESTRVASNIIHLVDRVDALLSRQRGTDPALMRPCILEILEAADHGSFAPEVLEAFREVSARDAFWFGLDADALHVELAPLARNSRYRTLTAAELTELASIFASIVDAKSPFTGEHSAGVGRLSAHLAALAGLDEEHRHRVEIAALLHDVGKLRIPDAILDKPGPLDPAEWATMKRHAYYTYQILAQITGFDEIAVWAGYHHESPNGSGYPFGGADTTLSLESRIVSVADVVQALAQARPYREPLSPGRTMVILDSLVSAGKLDGDLVALVAADRDACWQLAVGHA